MQKKGFQKSPNLRADSEGEKDVARMDGVLQYKSGIKAPVRTVKDEQY